MPITVLTPEGGVIAPGQMITVVSDVVGPFEPGSILTLDFFQTGGEVLCGRWSWQIANSFNFVQLDEEHRNNGPYQAALPDAAAVTVVGQISGPSGVVDSGTTTDLVWSTTGQLPELLEDITTGSGITEEERAQLQETHDATVTEMTIGGSSQVLDLISMLLHPPLGLTVLSALTPPQSGDGTIPEPTEFHAGIWGVVWHFTVVPPHLGRVLLGLPRFSIALLQLRVVHTIGGVDFYSEVIDADRDNVIFRWTENFPTRIEYSIIPGVQVQFNWLI